MFDRNFNNWEMVEGSGYYFIYRHINRHTYCVYDSVQKCFLDETESVSINSCEKIIEDLNEEK